MPDLLPLKRPQSPADLAAIIATTPSVAQVKIIGSNAFPLTRFVPTRPLQPISTLRMNKILHHSVPDMTISVHAGITLEALQRHLAWHNQWLPIDPPTIAPISSALTPQAQGSQSLGSLPTPGNRTLAGLIASNSLGPLRFANSATNDYRLLILGMKWIDAKGTLIKGGGQTMKNVAGYSTPRLLVGSCGSLGAIAEVTLRTYARPEDERCVLFFCDSAATAENLLAEIYLAPTTPAYLQLIGGHTFSSNPLQLPTPADNPGLIVVAGFLGRPATCSAQLEILRPLPAAKPLESISQTAAQAGRLRLWMTTEPQLPADATAHIGFRLHTLSSNVAPLLESLQRHDPTAWLVAEAQGILRGAITSTKLPPLPQNARLLITQGPRPPQPINPLLQRLKHALDPNATFGHAPTL